MQKEQFEARIKELLPNMTEQAMDKWTQYAQELEQDGTEKASDLYDAAYVELRLFLGGVFRGRSVGAGSSGAGFRVLLVRVLGRGVGGAGGKGEDHCQCKNQCKQSTFHFLSPFFIQASKRPVYGFGFPFWNNQAFFSFELKATARMTMPPRTTY